MTNADLTHPLPRLYATSFTYDDRYVPKSAVLVIDALRGLDDESLVITITLAAYAAEAEMMRN